MTNLIYSLKYKDQYTKIVGKTRGIGCTHKTLWDALAVSESGDRILVTENQNLLTSQVIIFSDIEIVFQPNIYVINKGVVTFGIRFQGDKIKTKNMTFLTDFSLVSSYEFSGNLNHHSNIGVIFDGSGATLTNAYLINSGFKANYIRGYARQLSGTITNPLVDNSGNITNDTTIRTMIG